MAVLWLGSIPAGSASASACRPSELVRVGSTWQACTEGGDRVVVLRSGRGSRPADVRFAGRYLAFHVRSGNGRSLRVWNLRTGRQIRSASLSDRVYTHRFRLRGLRLHRSGTVGYTLDGPGWRGVYALDRWGNRPLDRRPDVDLGSLGLRGERLTWQVNGTRQTTEIPQRSRPAAPRDCAIPPAAEDAVPAGATVTYKLRVGDPMSSTTTLFGCHLDGPPVRLAAGYDDLDSYSSEFFGVEAINGPFVAISATSSVFRSSHSALEVRDARSGAVTVRGHETSSASGFGDEGYDQLLRALISSSGNLAYVLETRKPTYDSPPRYSVSVIDRAGERRLDEDPTLEPRSVRLDGTALRWISRGAQRQATLD